MFFGLYKRKKIKYQAVKIKVNNWVVKNKNAEEKGLRYVNKGHWHKKDLYQALISTCLGEADLINKYGRLYVASGGQDVSILYLIANKGALMSVSGVLEFLEKNGINNTLAIYTLALLAKADNGVNIAKALYSELAKRDVKKSLPFGIWSAIYLDEPGFTEHVLKRLSWCDDPKSITVAFEQVFAVANDLKDDFLALILENLPAKTAERLIRKNIDQLDYDVLGKALLNSEPDAVYSGILKKVAAHFWSKKQYLFANDLYGRLLRLSPEEVVAERYLLSSEYSGSSIDESLNFISDIKAGIRLFEQGSMPGKSWFSKFPVVARKAIDDVVHAGNLTLAKEICEKAQFAHPKLLHWTGLLDVKDNGLQIPELSSSNKAYNSKVAYLLYNSLPVHSGGYATRTHGILTNLMSKGITPYPMTRLGYPYDLNKFKSREVETCDTYDGIDYHRLLDGPGLNFVPLHEYLDAYVKTAKKYLLESDSSVVHAASNHINGIAAVIAGRELGLKTVFEVRGMWEVTRLSRQPEWEGSDEFKAYRYLETIACEKADVVITITEALKAELISRGVDGSKVNVVSNGVDTSVFKPMVPNYELKNSLNIPKNNAVIGYVGSVVDYEGLDLLVESIALLVSSGKTNITSLIIGDGVVLDDLKSQVTNAGLDDYFVFTGRVPHEDVPDYYSIIDVCPFPRRGLPVCELVSPLKPFEAMAMGKVIIGSSVRAIAEFITEGQNGFVHEKDDAKDLAMQIQRALESPEVTEKLKVTTRQWVVENRDWKVLSDKVFDIYAQFE